jgi:hypothetical protein
MTKAAQKEVDETASLLQRLAELNPRPHNKPSERILHRPSCSIARAARCK